MQYALRAFAEGLVDGAMDTNKSVSFSARIDRVMYNYGREIVRTGREEPDENSAATD